MTPFIKKVGGGGSAPHFEVYCHPFMVASILSAIGVALHLKKEKASVTEGGLALLHKEVNIAESILRKWLAVTDKVEFSNSEIEGLFGLCSNTARFFFSLPHHDAVEGASEDLNRISHTIQKVMKQ